jgi:hypothetical protein
MKSKKLISLFLFLVLGIQVLPLQKIAAWLGSGQVTEEIVHNINPVKAETESDDVDPSHTFYTTGPDIHSILASSPVNYHRDETLYVRHADDILIPPPNC